MRRRRRRSSVKTPKTPILRKRVKVFKKPNFDKVVCTACRKAVKPAHLEDQKGKSHKTQWCTCNGPIVLNHATATPSSLWKYVGLHVASHERYTKGEAGGGNKTLRTVLWNSANTMMKLKDSRYQPIYYQVKDRLAVSEKVVQTRNTEGKSIEVAWKNTKPGHRHGAALRAIMKHLLADYWMVGRTLRGLPTVPLYAESMLGHTHIVSPRERGWNY